MTVTAALLKPRKSPVQARSVVTLDALHSAAIQVLTREGLGRCTTTRIAARAGISVGSLYQYYPNRDSLLAAVLEKHLDGVARAVERACRGHQGKPVAEMASGLVTVFLDVKLRNPRESRALYVIAEGIGGAKLAERLRTRMVTAMTDMLVSASDAHFADPDITAAIALSSLVGPVRLLLDGHAPTGFEASLEKQLVVLLTAFLQAHAN